MLIVLFARGVTLDLEACASDIAPRTFEKSWRTGEPGLLGRVAQDNGFTLTLADTDQPADAFAELARSLEACAPWIRRLVAEGHELTVSLGVFVTYFAPRSVVFPKDLLQRMVELDVSVAVRAYPVAEEDDEDDADHEEDDE